MPEQTRPEPSREQRVNEAIADYLDAQQAGRKPDPNDWLARHPDLADELGAFFAGKQEFDALASPSLVPQQPAPTPPVLADVATLPPDAPLRQAETVLPRVRYFGDYELLEEIARGGMGVVYRARQVSLNRVVALKMILAGQLASDEDVRRFHAEAQTAANLRHPNIVAIHEVGEHEGQHYFSMDLVEGWSLAELVREHPLPPQQAAEYVRIIAEAIHFAHERGVLHRDLKPANILIADCRLRNADSQTAAGPAPPEPSALQSAIRNPQSAIKITDFGLAKQLGAQGKTATGAVVGTPGYMPPEQASGERGKLSPASDVYSLGAILYELVTGRPPFQAATPLDTLLQVLEAEPASPRLLNRLVSRDLETIILKCLAKEPRKRYATAQALAEDLRAFLEGRAIKARRPGLLEQGTRWLSKQGKTVKVSLAAAGITVVGLLALGWYVDSLQGRVGFTTQGPPLTAEVLEEDRDRPVGAKFTIPTTGPVALDPGNYRLRVSTRYQLSEVFHFPVISGDKLEAGPGSAPGTGPPQEFALDLKDRHLWEPFRVVQTFDVVELAHPQQPGERRPRRNDIIQTTPNGLTRIDGATGETLWSENFAVKYQPALAARSYFSWDAVKWRPEDAEPEVVVNPAPDLDGDGYSDVVWISRNTPSLLAVSGKDGHVLWWHYSLPSLPPGTEVSRVHQGAGSVQGVVVGRVVGMPAVVDRLGPAPPPAAAGHASAAAGAGAPGVGPWLAATNLAAEEGRKDLHGPVLLATMRTEFFQVLVTDPSGKQPVGGLQGVPPGSWVVAVAARSGRTLWRTELKREWFKIPQNLAIELYAAAVHPVAGKPTVLCVAGNSLVYLDLATGQVMRVVDLKKAQTLPPRLIDLTGDGSPELVLLEPVENAGPGIASTSLRVLSLPEGRVLWEKTGLPSWRILGQPGATGPLVHERAHPEWPLIVAPGTLLPPLDAASNTAVILPGENGAVLALAGASGMVLWQGEPFPLRKEASYVKGYSVSAMRLQVGPDLDGDGKRELFRAVLLNKTTGAPGIVLCDALSGSSGKRLWLWRTPATPYGVSPLGHEALRPLRWLPGGPDGWPVLVVPFFYSQQPLLHTRTFLLSTGSGRLLHEVPGLAHWLPPRDLDGDGLPDLLAVHSQDSQFAAKLYAFRMYAPDVWRRLGEWQVTGDLDGDGVADLLKLRSGTTVAVSGRDGRMLWRSPEGGQTQTGGSRPFEIRGPARAFPLPHSDLDGDGTPDLLVWSGQSHPGPLAALSGKTGTKLWSAKEELVPKDHHIQGHGNLSCHDLDADGQGEVLLLYRLRHQSAPGNFSTLTLAVLSSTGKLRWKQTLGAVDVFKTDPAPTLGDLNGDGVLDVVVMLELMGQEQGNFQVLALDGKTGQALWEAKEFTGVRPGPPHLFTDRPNVLLADLDSDGKAEVVVRCRLPLPVKPPKFAQPDWKPPLVPGLHALRGSDGETLWTWTRPAEGDFVWDAGEPVLVRRAGKTPLLAVSVYDGRRHEVDRGAYTRVGKTGRQLLLLDGRGKEIQGRDILYNHPLPFTQVHTATAPLWAHDLDGDGSEEVLYVDDGRLRAVLATGEDCWLSPVLGQTATIKAFLPDAGAAAGKWPVVKWVVVQAERSWFGLDARSGKVAWRCEGPGERAELMPASAPGELPRVVYHVNLQPRSDVFQFTASRRPLPTTGEGDFLPLGKGELVPVRDVEFVDERPLPWARWPIEAPHTVYPIYWGTGFFLLFLVGLVVTKGWRSLLAPLVIYLVLLGLHLGINLFSDLKQRLPEERYAWDNWWFILLPPAAITGGLALAAIMLTLVVGVPLRLLLRGPELRQRRQRLLSRFRWGFLALGAVLLTALYIMGAPLRWVLILVIVVVVVWVASITVHRPRPGPS